MKNLIIIILSVIPFIAFNQEKIEIKIKVEGIRNSQGQIVLSAFKTEKEFDDETPVYNFTIDKSSIKDGVINTSVRLPIGNWGLTLLDDENSNAKMEYNFFGITEEGFGFSNYYLIGLRKPLLDDFDFNVNNKDNVSVKMKIRYM